MVRENGWSGDWTPLERETHPVEPPATHRQKKAKPSELSPSEPQRGRVPPPKQQRRRQAVALFDLSERRKLPARVGGGSPSAGPLGVPLGERSFLTLTLTLTLTLPTPDPNPNQVSGPSIAAGRFSHVSGAPGRPRPPRSPPRSQPRPRRVSSAGRRRGCPAQAERECPPAGCHQLDTGRRRARHQPRCREA